MKIPPLERKTRLVVYDKDDSEILNDMERYKAKALEYGVTDAKVIPASMIEVDERVRLKCYIPRCHNYGRCEYCPPNTPEPEFMRKAIARYKWALVFRKSVDPVGDLADKNNWFTHTRNHYQMMTQIVANLELMAFADAYYLALGLSCGGCRSILCGDLECPALDRGGLCPYPLKARPSIESMGIDVFGLVAKLGWDIFPIYLNVEVLSVPKANLVGCILVV